MTNGQFNAPSKPLIQSLGGQTIELLIDGKLKLIVFKCLNDPAPIHLSEVCIKNVDCAARNIRATTTDLRLPSKSSSIGQIALRAEVQIWNSLSTEVKQASSFDAFNDHM